MYEAIPQERLGVTSDVGDLLRRVIAETRPAVTLEIGMAHGISTQIICEALQKVGGKRHIALDPLQSSEFKGAGRKRVVDAGFGALLEVREQESQFALAQLVTEGVRVDFAFIDGAHTLDHTLVDFFFTDRLLDVGGIVAFDDANFPAIHHLCRFIATNRAYRVWGTTPGTGPKLGSRAVGWAAQRSSTLRKALQTRFVVTDDALKLPPDARCVAFEKLAGDTRSLSYSFETF